MSLFTRLRSFEDDIDFRRVWKVGTSASMVVLLIALWGIVGRGLNLGLDFEGGTSWDVPSPSLSVDDARDALRSTGQESAKIQVVGRGDSRVLRVQSTVDDVEVQDQVSDDLAEAAGVEVTDITVSTVGPSWGDQVTSKAQRALVWFFVVVAAYIAWRLEWKMAVGALIAVVHDIVISVGFYAVFQIEVTPATVIAFLTILGYSLYDTIVVFDRVKENSAKLTSTGRYTYTGIMSLSLNQVLMRSLNTTITSLIPVVAMLVVGSFVLGAVALQEFAVALTVGLMIGAFSSVFIASPVVALLKEREPAFRRIRDQGVVTRGPAVATGEAPADAAGSVTPPKRSVVPGQAPGLSGRPIPPRPRKQGKRR